MTNAWKWDDATKRLLKRIIDEVAAPALSAPEPDVPPGIINSKNADRIMIESGCDDLSGNTDTIFLILDGLDQRDRHDAYSALFHLIRGTLNIGMYAYIPIGAPHTIDAAQVAIMRRRRAEKGEGLKATREAAISAVLADNKRRHKNQPAIKNMIVEVNNWLEAKGHKTIGERTLRRDLARLEMDKL